MAAVLKKQDVFCLSMILAFVYLFLYVDKLFRIPGNSGHEILNNNVYPDWLKNIDLKSRSGNIRVILIYTVKFSWRTWHTLPHKNFSEECGCNLNNCRLTYDKRFLVNASVVVFNGKDLPSFSELKLLRRQKPFGQLFVYYTKENPMSVSYAKHKVFFDLTSTYLLDSAVRIPYRYHFKVNSEKQSKDYFTNKTKEVAWIVSNCNQLRDGLAHKLAKYGVKIHIAGQCLKRYKHRFKCGERSCRRALAQFKFFFAAENHLCPAYVTEKYWYKSLDNDIIPIVLGGADYTNPNLIIPGSFINAMDFSDVFALSKYIKEVANDRKKYNDYFSWKSAWRLSREKNGCNFYFCNLCQRLHKGLPFNGNNGLASFNRNDCVDREKKFRRWLAN